MRKISSNYWLFGGVIFLSFLPVLIFQGQEFKATDSKNGTAIEEVKPGYQPWFEPVIKPSGGEVETFLFAVQAAVGAGITGYILGLYKGRAEGKKPVDRTPNEPQD
jgi:cobalt/nickel transport protein